MVRGGVALVRRQAFAVDHAPGYRVLHPHAALARRALYQCVLAGRGEEVRARDKFDEAPSIKSVALMADDYAMASRASTPAVLGWNKRTVEA